MMSRLAFQTKESSMAQKMLQFSQSYYQWFLSSWVTRMSFSLRSSSHSFFFFQDYSIGVWVLLQSANSSPIRFLVLCLITMHFSNGLTTFSSILLLLWISTRWLFSKIFSSSSLLRYSFFSLWMNCINFRYLMMVMSMKKLSRTFSQTLKLLQLIQIISRPIASQSFISNYLLQISSFQHIIRLFFTIITGSNISLQTNQTWNPMCFRTFSNFQDKRCFLRSLERIRLISDRLSSGGKMKIILERSSSQKNSVFFWQNCKMCLKSFSFKHEMMILSKIYSLMQLFPIMTISAISYVQYIILGPFCSSYFLQTPKIFLRQLSFSKFFMADFVYETLLLHMIKFNETQVGFVRILCECFKGFNAQFIGLPSMVFTFMILKIKIISSSF